MSKYFIGMLIGGCIAIASSLITFVATNLFEKGE